MHWVVVAPQPHLSVHSVQEMRNPIQSDSASNFPGICQPVPVHDLFDTYSIDQSILVRLSPFFTMWVVAPAGTGFTDGVTVE